MTGLKRVLVVLGLIVGCSITASARAKIPVGEREVLKMVVDLPDTEDYLLEDGTYVDIARLHTEFSIAYVLPLYITEEPRLVGYSKSDDSCIDLDRETIDLILSDQGLEEKKLLKLPFYTRYGGKIVGGILVLLAIIGFIPSKKEKVKSVNV